MTGHFRFFLAFLVLISHLNIRFLGMNEGVFAVTIFYILAGHVVTKLFMEKINVALVEKKLLIFYTERFLRIYPLYFSISFITILFLIITGYGNPVFDFCNVILNLLIVPLNYYMYIEKCIVILASTNPPWWLIPPAWSLGTEIQAYIILPLLLMHRTLGLFVFWSSYFIYSLANLNIIHSDYFGYRLIPGVIFIFLSGAYLQKTISGKASRYEIFSLIFMYFISVLWFIYFIIIKKQYGAYTRETLLGLIIGIPLVFLLLRIRKKIIFNHLLGNLSYGIFLSHFLAFWIMDFFNLNFSIYQKIFISTVLSICISFPFITVIERKIEKIRYKIIYII